MSAPKAEIEALWRALFGGPPPIDAAPEMLIAVMVRCLPQPSPYGYGGPIPARAPEAVTDKPPLED